jgi:class 3 adenylate cyclase
MSEGPTAPAASGSSSSTYRCFLFADLRGYTAFVERAGNAAAVALLQDYLSVTRRAVAQHHGAEIKTEGDGFYAVFPSASSAIMCGLDIVRSAGEASADRPDRPIRVGVGINAGEAIQTAEGYVGSAINLAARVCAVADPGEVLVTATVRGIAHTSVEVGFARRGRRRLKGVAEPVEIFAVTSERIAPPVRRRRGPWLLAAGGILGAAAIVVAAVLVLRLPAPGGAATAPPASKPASVQIGGLSIGTYLADQFQPPFELVIADPGWRAYRNGSEYLGLYYETEPKGHVDIGRVEGVYEIPCSPDGPVLPVGATPGDLLDALMPSPDRYLGVVGSPEAITVGSHLGLAADVEVSEGALAACGSFGTGEVSVFAIGDETWTANPGERFHIAAIDVDGVTVAIMQSADPDAAGSVSALERFFAVADRVVDQMSFVQAGASPAAS